MTNGGEAFGFRVRTKITRPAAALVRKFGDVRSSDLADAMREANFMDSGIRPMYTPMARFGGPAVTVTVPRGSHFPLFKLGMQQTQPGDVLVVNARGDSVSAVIGGNIAKALKARGVAGVIIDGAARDIEETQAVGLPVHVRSVTPNAGNSYGPGEINVPIACGGVVVNPGDIVIADEDGIAVVPPFAAEAVLARAIEVRHKSSQDPGRARPRRGNEHREHHKTAGGRGRCRYVGSRGERTAEDAVVHNARRYGLSTRRCRRPR